MCYNFSMIAHIEGTVAEKFGSSVIVDVSGVGYEIALSAIDYDETNLNDKKKFYTYHKVSETSEDLFGFSTLAAKKIFELLISVNGVGPKAGMAILSLGTPEDVRNAMLASSQRPPASGRNPPNVSLSTLKTRSVCRPNTARLLWLALLKLTRATRR